MLGEYSTTPVLGGYNTTPVLGAYNTKLFLSLLFSFILLTVNDPDDTLIKILLRYSTKVMLQP